MEEDFLKKVIEIDNFCDENKIKAETRLIFHLLLSVEHSKVSFNDFLKEVKDNMSKYQFRV